MFHLTFKTEHRWNGAYTSFTITRSGKGTVERTLKLVDGTTQNILIEQDYVEYFDNKKEMKDMYFDEIMKNGYSISVVSLSNEILSDLKYMDSFVLGVKREKFSVLFLENKFYLINKNSFKFEKDYKCLDFSSEKKFRNSVNHIIMKHILGTQEPTINHYNNRIITLKNNFNNMSAIYNEIIKRKYYA